MALTSTQQEAVLARGNVLVVAGAGTGKTRTLVERCLDCLLREQPRASFEEILLVTFTEAAAAEMRQRIRARLERELEEEPRAHPPSQAESERAGYIREQLALFETAHIGTLHSFCLQLLRQHFYELEMDPQLSVMAQDEARLLAEDTLEELLKKHYAGRGPAAEAVQQLIQLQGRGGDKSVRGLVLRLHHYTQTQPDPAGWLDAQLERFAQPHPELWETWLRDAVCDWPARWLPMLREKAAANQVAAWCAEALGSFRPAAAWKQDATAVLEAITAAVEACPHGKKGAWLQPLEEFFEEATFLYSLLIPTPASAPPPATTEHLSPTPAPQPATDPLAQDWAWVRGHMLALLQLARDFTAAFAEAKRELGVVDFHDLEQCALRLLWDAKANRPTKIAQEWRQKLRFVFVDEYQDINAAQDKIIEALSREGAAANRFLVGDVKQSIYRFRLAAPHIFQGYVESWRRGAGRVIPLVENFRSREGILDFVNSLFSVLLRRELGGLDYDAEAQLRFGAASERRPLSRAASPAPCVELHVRAKRSPTDRTANEQPLSALAQLAELEEAEKEARLVALRLREVMAEQHPIWDEATKAFRPVAWSDMAVLLRAPANKGESYAKEFSRLHVPLLVERRGFYESLEISDLLSLLQLLDNPLQDLPALAVLRSPLVGLTLNELAEIRLTAPKVHFWTALLRWQEKSKVQSPKSKVHGPQSTVRSPQATVQTPKPEGAGAERGADQKIEIKNQNSDTDACRKVATFLERFARWRRLSRQASLSRCLEALLAETHYGEWLLTQPRGEQRQANVQRLVGLGQQFDRFQRQGLFRFLRFIEAQQLAETEPEVAAFSEENSVRLMSIHQSKGLEFPIVVLADLGKAFNKADLHADIILDEQYGLCPQIKPPQTGKRYPSLPHWLARRRQERELLGEELRLLYVAMTRARDHLILAGSIAGKRFDKFRSRTGELDPAALLSARSCADWLALWMSACARTDSAETTAASGEIGPLRWALHDDSTLTGDAAAPLPPATPGEEPSAAGPETWRALEQRLTWQYPFAAATRQPAKTSVSLLRRRAAEYDEETAALEVQSPLFGVQSPKSKVQSRTPASLTHEASRKMRPAPRTSAADVGTAHHAFQQWVALDRTGSLADLESEVKRLAQEQVLSPEEIALLDLKSIAAFWTSDLGRKLCSQTRFIQRELPFTARFSPNELAALTGLPLEPALESEFVVVQGVADLAVILPQEIWLLDFKTDRLGLSELADRVKLYGPQLMLYSEALARIYHRPVSSAWLYFFALDQAVPLPPVS